MKKIIFFLTALVITFSMAGVVNADAASAKVGDKNLIKFYVEVKGIENQPNTAYYSPAVYETQTVIPEDTERIYTKDAASGKTEADVLAKAASVPSDADVFATLKTYAQNKKITLYDSNQNAIDLSALNTSNYEIDWYLYKYVDPEWNHIDGRIIKKESICVKYDVKSGTFVSGKMNVIEHKPISNVAYTVLNEDGFRENNMDIPQELKDAAVAVADLVNARLNQLPDEYKNRYGRVDSQGWKMSYVRGEEDTLRVTPFVTENLQNIYGIDRMTYMWLAMGDRNGNVETVYVMNRAATKYNFIFADEN